MNPQGPDERDHDEDEEVVFQVYPESPAGQVIPVGTAYEREQAQPVKVVQLSGSAAGASSARGELTVLPPPPPVVSSYPRLKHVSFFIDFWHSGDQEEMYQVRMTQSDRVSEWKEWEELDHDLAAIILALANMMRERME